MSIIIQIVNQEGKRMCVYSQRDYEYMVGRGWKMFPTPVDVPLVPEIDTTVAKTGTPKKRGRPAKVEH